MARTRSRSKRFPVLPVLLGVGALGLAFYALSSKTKSMIGASSSGAPTGMLTLAGLHKGSHFQADLSGPTIADPALKVPGTIFVATEEPGQAGALQQFATVQAYHLETGKPFDVPIDRILKVLS